MEGWTVLEQILGGAGALVLLGILTFVWRCGHRLVKMVKDTADNVQEMKAGGEVRKQESKLLFKGILTIFEVLGGKEMNGNIRELEEAYTAHFVEKVN
jgi:hypothetical protein